MVFESIVTDLMNRFLGDFIENLDKKQLNIGIWGGDVVLKNLQLKQDALKELDLPVQTVYGKLGKLVLKIPWKNLYSLPVEADIEDLYLLVAPNNVVSYNAEKQEKAEIDAKKAELIKVDEAKKRELEKDKQKEVNKSFTEKLVAQIINNVQIKIQNVHIRYEDRSTSVIPFALGITLGGLSVHTTDIDWNKTFLSEALSKVFKVAKLDGLAVYMNCNTSLFQSHPNDELNALFLKTIAKENILPDNFSYILGPINAVAKLKLNMNPELDDPAFEIPKVDLFLEMEKLAVGITKTQYQRLINLADGMSTMARGIPYRKWRPYNTPYKGNYKLWWKFAYTCILETQIRRIKNNWSWIHMQQHRKQCKAYADAFKCKLTTKKPTAAIVQACEQYEEKVDLFNLLLIRQQVELDVEISGKLQAQQAQKSSWFGWWYGNGKDGDSDNKDGDILDKFKTAMTADEKAKLYTAIGYHEGGVPTELPDNYVALVMQFSLKLLEICVKNESLCDDKGITDHQKLIEKQSVLSLQIHEVSCEIGQRPATSGLKLDILMREFTVFGFKQHDYLPVMVKSKIDQNVDTNLLSIKFEMNPLDKECDQRVSVSARPLKIVYDAETIIQLVQVFKMPKNTNLSELTDAASIKISSIKERSATGIQYMIEKHTRLELNISVMPNYVIIPYGGIYKKDIPLMLISLGKLTLKSQPTTELNVSTLHTSGTTGENILKVMMEQAYDKMQLEIQEIQILIAKPNENWKEALTAGKVTEMHFLQPTSLFLGVDLCVVDDDPRLPKTKVSAKIPNIGISVTEDRILEAIALATSIPLPENDDIEPMPLNKQSTLISSSMSLKRYLDEKQQRKSKRPELKRQELSEEIVQYTDLEFAFVMSELSVNIFRTTGTDSSSTSITSHYRTPTDEFFETIDGRRRSSDIVRCSSEHTSKPNQEKMLSFQVKQLEMDMVQKTYEMTVCLKLGAILLDQYHPPDITGHVLTTSMIETPKYADKNGYLVSLCYTNANKESPEFTTKYKSIEQLIQFNFAILTIRLHQEGLVEILQIANKFQTKLERVSQAKTSANKDRIASAGEPLIRTKLERIVENPNEIVKSRKEIASSKKSIASVVDSIKVKLVANMEELGVKLVCQRRDIADLQIKNLKAGVVLKTSYTEVIVKLQDIIVTDMNPKTFHSNILSVVGGNALKCQLVLYNVKETKAYNSDDMKIDVSMGCVKIVFLNWFVSSILNFLDNFQTAQTAIAEASAAAAETAKQNMVEAYSNATRMKLNVRIKAPIIIVPIDSTSLQAITIDFGHLCITNSISEIPDSAKESGPGILDDMKLELKDMKISKVTLCKLQDVNKPNYSVVDGIGEDMVYGINVEGNMLNPTSFALIIKRNLSASWYKNIPELDVSGRLNSIVINLMPDDYKLLMLILAKNLNEGADERAISKPPPPKPKPFDTVTLPTCHDKTESKNESSNYAVIDEYDDEVAKDAWSKAVKNTNEPKPFGLDISAVKAVSPTSPTKIDTFLKFSFQMDSFICNLFTERDVGLASFGIYFLSLKGYKLVDESLSASIVLCDVQLDDKRPDRQNCITKFMKKRDSPTPIVKEDTQQQPSTSMVDIVARMTTNEVFVNLKVSSFDLILSLEFLNKIVKFITIPEDETNTPVTAVPTAPGAPAQKIVQPKQIPTEPPSNKQTIILLNVDEPDIILVEQMDDINCLALILNNKVALRVRMQAEQQIIRGEISDLKVYICEFNPARRNSTKHFVLQPCTLTLHANTPEERGMNISLNVSDVRVNISPAIIELLNKTMQTLTGEGQKSSGEEESVIDYSEIWKVKPYKEEDFWFMKVEDAQEALMINQTEGKQPLPEVCIVEIPSIIVVIETGLGYYTFPLLVLETKMNAEVKNWSSTLSISSSLCLGMAYYNSQMAVWESIIEPNEREKANGLTEYGPWELNFSMCAEKIADESTLATTENDEQKQKITISSSDILEMTVTKTCLDVLQDLGAAFSEAIRPEGLHKPDIIAPFIIQNDTGFDITLNLKLGALQLHSCHLPTSERRDTTENNVIFQNSIDSEIDPNAITTCKISPGGRAYLQAKAGMSTSTSISAFSTLNQGTTLKEMFIYVKIGDIDKEIILPVHKADRRYFPLYRDTNKEPWGIISHVKTEYGSTVITIHGVLKIKNHFSTVVNVFRLRNNVLHEIGQVPPGETFNVPLYALYASPKDLYFSILGYKTSVQGINWKENPSDFMYTKYLQCDPDQTFEPFYITVIREREEVYHEVTSKFTMLSACYIVNLKPPLYLKNALPIDIQVSVAGCSVSQSEEVVEADESMTVNGTKQNKRKEDFLDYGEKVVKPGDVLHLPTVKMTVKEGENKSYIVARLVQYLEKDWSCSTEIPSNPPEVAVWTFTSYDSVEKMTLDLGVKFENRHGSLQLTIYCPFWMINKTGQMLSYMSADENVNILYHPPELEGPILFSYREKVFFGKKRASVRVDMGEWSERFALDAAGSTGVVECKANDITYEIAVHNTLTSNSLTKQIMFVPMYVMVNKAPFPIEVQEDRRPGDPWILVNPDQCVPLWPKETIGRRLKVKTQKDIQASSAFSYNEVQCCLLKMENEYGGINVDVQVNEGGIYIIFTAYHPGDAPALVINHTNGPISFWEKGNVNERKLEPYEMVLYTWIDPAGDRLIVWNDGNKQIESDLRRDDANHLRPPNDDIYWISFLDGTQRILLFTNDSNIASDTHSASRLDKVTQEIEVDIHGIGLSLVNNIKHCDIMYIGIASSGIIWEEKKKLKYFKQMKIQEVQIMEQKYQQYLLERYVGNADAQFYLDATNKIRIDFDENILFKSHPRPIRRTFYPGLWIQIKSSPYTLQFHAKINRIQIDNQLGDCIFPVVLAPVPPPRSFAALTALKPFIECSVVQRVIPHSNVKQFKYLTMLIQEFHVKVDLLFINEIVEMVSTEVSDEESQKRFAADIERQKEPLSALVLTHSSQEQKNFYDQLHLGPLKIHISFSMAGLEPGALPGVLSTILQGVGVTLTDINDIVFRLSFFQREYTFLTQRQLTSEIVSHYAGQAVKQAYVLILGLDVIGNPYGLVVGFTKGVEDLFYEPFQGAILGPGEFAEGLVLGVRSLFGHTVGGAAGAVSKITGAMGKGLAALTFDKEYQRKRREQLNKKPANLQEGLARSGKGLVMGVFDGVTGVFTKPISGAREEGVEGFFKGLGKGAVGLVARPTAGIVDFASGTFDSVKRAAEMSEDVNRLRPPRFLHADGIVRPFCAREAEGFKLLKEIEKGKYANSDIFVHYESVRDKRDVLLLSDQRILYCVKNDLFGGWQVDWTYRWKDVSVIVKDNRGIEIVIGEKTKKVMGIFGSSNQLKKLIPISQPAKREHVAKIMHNLKSKAV